jgi:hypothetical protein
MHMPPTARRRAAWFPIALMLALLVLALAGPTGALAKGGGPGSGGGDGGGGGGGGGGRRPEVRVTGSCGRGATSSLELRARDGGIEAEFEVHGRSGWWRVAIVQEQRLAYRGRAHSSRLSHSFWLERRLSDYAGPDHVFARAVGPRGITCQATATLPG